MRSGSPNAHPRDLNRCGRAFITDERGAIIKDPVPLRLAENHFWLSLADSDVLLWCKERAAGAECSFT
jgi:aminomethyltransferase